jgi:hypothetical protein
VIHLVWDYLAMFVCPHGDVGRDYSLVVRFFGLLSLIGSDTTVSMVQG